MNFIAQSGKRLSDWSERNMPNPYLFAVILTFIAYFMGWFMTDNGPMDMINHWYDGFWKYLKFAMQMVLILVTGHALAIAPGVHPALRKLARMPKTPGQAVLFTAYVATIFTYFHWGLGLIVAAIFAREEIALHLDLGAGDGVATVWTCDLTREYVAINADYRS